MFYKNFKKIGFFILFFCFLAFNFFIFSAENVNAACKKNVTIIARNANGEYLTNISFKIYRQVVDVDGKPKPGKSVASGNIDPILGKSIVEFDDDDYTEYALKIWDKKIGGNPTAGAFWFYNNLTLNCEESVEITKYLSGINFVLRDTEENLRKNTAFSIYTQREDADENPIKEKQDLVANLNTSEEGEVVLYIPNKSKSIDNKGSSYYIFESKGKDGGTFIYYDLYVGDTTTLKFQYVFSDIVFTLKDVYGNLYPADSKIEILEQTLDQNDKKTTGEFLKTLYTNDEGVAIFEYPSGTYVARIKDSNGQYEFFWNLEMNNRARNNITLTTDSEWSPASGTCEEKSELTIIAKNFNFNYIPNLNFELYEQTVDANNRPVADKKIKTGKIDNSGIGTVIFNPDPRKFYALKIYDKKSNVGEFWFFNDLKFVCGNNLEITKYLTSINFVLRNADGDLKKNQKFSLYTQKLDIDGNPIKEKNELISSSLSTSEEGSTVIYAAPDHPYIMDKVGRYIFSSIGGNKAEFIEYNIDVVGGKSVNFEYIFSDLILKIENAEAEKLPDKQTIEIFHQEEDIDENLILGDKIQTIKLGDDKSVKFEYPSGDYAVKIKDSTGKDYFYFWNIKIKNQKRKTKKLVTNIIRVDAKENSGKFFSEGTGISVYSMVQDENEYYHRNKKITSSKITNKGYVDFSLTPNPYLFVLKKDKKEYGAVLYAEQSKLHRITLNVSPYSLTDKDTKYKIAKPVKDYTLTDKLKGYILLQVEDDGEAWYVDAKSRKRYYMEDGASAFQIMREFGLGITDKDLSKIEIGFDDRFNDFDFDKDGLPDKMEEALGTDMENLDSDNDGFLDGEEVRSGYNPLGSGKILIDKNLSKRLKGKILLQVESRGEAWYLNPQDGKRYYMKDGGSSFKIMKFLSLGITNENIEEIEEGEL